MGLCCSSSAEGKEGAELSQVPSSSLHVAEDSKQLERDQEFIRLLAKLHMQPSIAPRDAYTINLNHIHGPGSTRTSAAGTFVRTSYGGPGAGAGAGAASNRSSLNGGDVVSSAGFYRVKSVVIPRGGQGLGVSSLPIGSPHHTCVQGMSSLHTHTLPPQSSSLSPTADDPHGLLRTQSRRVLEHLIQREDKRQGSGRPLEARERESSRVQEKRLASRLDRLNLDMVIQAGDGNCRSRISFLSPLCT